MHGSRELFGIPIDPRTLAEMVEHIDHSGREGSTPRMLATMNVDHVVNMHRREDFRRAYQQATWVTIDGAPVLAYAKAAGVRVHERVTGADLFEALLPRLRPDRHRLFFVLPSEAAAGALGTRLAMQGFSSDQFATAVPAFGFERSPQSSADLARQIALFAPSHLVMAIGSPKSEMWVTEHGRTLGGCTVLCVGAAVEFALGLKPRAPTWMRTAGLEWLHRVASEPKRLFRRYFLDSSGFLVAAMADWRSGGTSVR